MNRQLSLALSALIIVLIVVFLMTQPQLDHQTTKIENCLRSNPTYTVDACRVLTK